MSRHKRLALFAITVGILMLMATAALGQEVTPPVGDDTGLSLSAAALVAIAIKMLVDWVKTIPSINGVVTNIVATALGYGATYIEQVGTFSDWVSRVNTALVLAGTASVVSEVVKYMRAKRGADSPIV